MAVNQLSEHFARFFKVINPSPTWISKASSQYNTIKGVIEGAGGNAGLLKPKIFQQGSYGRETAIHTINDLDLVVLCELWYPPSSTASSDGRPWRSWSRNDIFYAIAEPLLADGRYAGKVYYGPTSTCIKLDLDIQVEILPVVFKSGNSDPGIEPFYLYRPERFTWEEGYAKYHQYFLSEKNKRTGGNFIPMVKVLKHIRSRFGDNSISFHIECLLHCLPDTVFVGSPADYIAAVIFHLTNYTESSWKGLNIRTPCGERSLFCESEWRSSEWTPFYELMEKIRPWLVEAVATQDRSRAIDCWKTVLGSEAFPAY